MDNNIPEIVLRVLRGNPTEDDMHIFLQWYHTSQANSDLFFSLKHIYNLRNGGLRPDEMELKASWERLLEKREKQSVIRLPSPEKTGNRRYIRIMRYTGAAVGAVLLLIIAIRGFNLKNERIEWVEVRTGAKSKPQTICLSDGSVVCLNASSLFRYPKKFDTKNREVYLDGEAYFSVTERKRQTFIVYTDKQQANVLGTEFNIIGYSSDPYTITTLVTGKVKLVTYDNEDQLKTQVVITANQQIYFDKESYQTTLSEVNASDATSWMKGIYSFRDTPLEEITHRLEKIHGVTIIIPDKVDRIEEYTGKFFSYQSLKEMVDLLNFKDQFRPQFSGDTVYLRRKQPA